MLNGVHLGHSLVMTLLFSSWMLYGHRYNLWFINLYKFMSIFRFVFILIKYLVRSYSPIWFVNMDASMSAYVKKAGLSCGEFWCGNDWIVGLLSNFNVVKKQLDTIYSLRKVSNNVSSFYNYIFLSRNSWPRAIFTSSVYHSSIVVKEAINTNIPCIGIIDTNTKSHNVSLALPGNDDSINSILFYNNIVCELILFYKFFYLVLWLSVIRKSKKIIKLSNVVFGFNIAFFSFFYTWVDKIIDKKGLFISNNNILNYFLYKVRLNNLALFFYSKKNKIFILFRNKKIRKFLKGRHMFKIFRKNRWKFIDNLDVMKKYSYKTKKKLWNNNFFKLIFFKYALKFYRFKKKNQNMSKLDIFHYIFFRFNIKKKSMILIQWFKKKLLKFISFDKRADLARVRKKLRFKKLYNIFKIYFWKLKKKLLQFSLKNLLFRRRFSLIFVKKILNKLLKLILIKWRGQ